MHQPWLTLARIGWIVIVVPAFILFIANIPAYFTALHQLAAPNAHVFNGQLTQKDVQALQSLGLSLNFYAICMVIASLLFQFSYAAVGILLFWRRSSDSIALLASFALMLFPFGYAYLTLQALPSQWSWLISVLPSLGNTSIMLCAYVFPNGKFVPGWTRWLAFVLFGFWVTTALFSWGHIQPLLYWMLFFGLVMSTMLAQLYRYYYISTPRERQQTKWVVFGISIAAAGSTVVRLLVGFILFPLWHESLLAPALEVILVTFSMLAIPPTLAFAILSSHLWDIDIIINRALVYTLLTASLTLIYTGLVVSLQFLSHDLIGGNQLAIISSTLVIAALFQPLRQRIQTIIDQHFYRRKYDAAQTLAAFSAAIRNEVDLNQLCEHLVAVVQETMQPASISLWLHEPEQESKYSAKTSRDD